MAHMIETMFSANDRVPWHGLGNILPDDMLEAGRAIREAGLDWEVAKEELYVPSGNGFIPLNDRYAIRRSDKEGAEAVLGVVGETYEPIQNAEMFAFGDELLDTGKAKYVTAGSLEGGRRIWALSKIDNCDVKIPYVDDVTEMFLLIYSSHDGSTGFTAAVTPIRVVCQNTANAALSAAKATWKVRHSGNAAKRTEEARRALGMVAQQAEEFEGIAERLYEMEMEEENFERMLQHLWPPNDEGEFSTRAQNDQEDVRQAYHNAESCNLDGKISGTRWAAWNAVTLFCDYGRSFQRSRKATEEENRFKNIMWGYSRTLKRRALDLLQEPDIPEVQVA